MHHAHHLPSVNLHLRAWQRRSATLRVEHFYCYGIPSRWWPLQGGARVAIDCIVPPPVGGWTSGLPTQSGVAVEADRCRSLQESITAVGTAPCGRTRRCER